MTSGLPTSLPIAAAIRRCAAGISLAIDSEIALSVAASVFTPLDRLATSRMLARGNRLEAIFHDEADPRFFL